MELLLALLGGLAVWRVTHMLQEENGPGAIFARLQAWVGNLDYKPGNFNDGFFCFYCMSIWWSFLAALAIEHTNWALFFVYWFAISTIAIFVDELHKKIEQ